MKAFEELLEFVGVTTCMYVPHFTARSISPTVGGGASCQLRPCQSASRSRGLLTKLSPLGAGYLKVHI